jgi:FtsP/CotA-like multicopper oxidase with cupredoxin domain
MRLDRRDLLRLGGVAALAAASGSPTSAQHAHHAPTAAPSDTAPPDGPADHTLRIAAGLLELGPETIVSTKLYNGQFPGPLLRFSEGKRAVVDIHNDTDTPEQLHWHGQFVPAEVDGAAEEGTPFIPARGMRRIAFTPGPAGFRFYHTHILAGADLSAGLYSGQVGPAYIEPKQEAGGYDREVFLTLKEFAPYLNRTEMPMDFLAPTDRLQRLREAATALEVETLQKGGQQGYELAYSFFAINGRMLGHGEPIRVKPGERLLLHVLNASATEVRSLALPGHVFRVVALDGNLVPRQAEVPVLWLGNGERVSAIVEMKRPGIWVLGDTSDEDRGRGMGIVVEYAGRKGKPQWQKPKPFRWDYRLFGAAGAPQRDVDETLEVTFAARPGVRDGFSEFTINNVAFSMEKMDPVFRLVRGKRYRLHMLNATDDVHPVHLHRHSFELTNIAGAPLSGVVKDVAMIGAFQEMSVDFTADQPGLSLFHCHMQHHMDFGFMALFDSG